MGTKVNAVGLRFFNLAHAGLESASADFSNDGGRAEAADEKVVLRKLDVDNLRRVRTRPEAACLGGKMEFELGRTAVNSGEVARTPVNFLMMEIGQMIVKRL